MGRAAEKLLREAALSPRQGWHCHAWGARWAEIVGDFSVVVVVAARRAATTRAEFMRYSVTAVEAFVAVSWLGKWRKSSLFMNMITIFDGHHIVRAWRRLCSTMLAYIGHNVTRPWPGGSV